MEEELAKSDLQARLSELREKLQVFPYRKSSLMKEFNNQLAFGEVAGAEAMRVKIQELEREEQALRLEINEMEQSLKN